MRSDWSHLDKYRVMDGSPYSSKPGDPYGAFEVPYDSKSIVAGRTQLLRIIANSALDGIGEAGEWEHVSVHAHDPQVVYYGGNGERIPTWEEMCFVKDLFWKEDECVIQFHPAKKDYVDVHVFVLHLWRSTKVPFPMPPKECV